MNDLGTAPRMRTGFGEGGITTHRIVRPRRVQAACSLLLLVACLGFLGAAAAGSFRVRRVEVVGHDLPRATIIRVAGVMGKNIFRVRSDAVVARLDAVRSIVVRRVDTAFPDTVTIYASARAPLVAWQQGRSLFELDADGRVIRQVRRTDLPVIIGADRTQRVVAAPDMVRAVRYAVQTLPAVPDGAIETFQLDGRSGLTIIGRTGWTAEIGTGTEQTLVNRVATLAAVLARMHSQARRLKYANLRYRVPYARYSGG